MKQIFWENKRFVIVEHEANEVGPGHVLEKFLIQHKVKEVFYIGHPNLYIRSGYAKSSRSVRFFADKTVKTITAKYFRLAEPLLYVKDCFYTLIWVLGKGKYDCFVGLGNLNAFCGILLRKMGAVKYVVYYVIDYVPLRFNNFLLNKIYHWIDKIAALNCDATWNLSPRMIEARERRWKMKFPNQKVVPHGLYFDKSKIPPARFIHKNEIIYMGHLNREQGIQLVIESIPALLKRIPDVTFRIIGTGNYESELRDLASRLSLKKHIIFEGLVKENRKMEQIIAMASVAVAMYEPGHGFSEYSDPGKIKHYLSVGLPVIMTSKPYVATLIQDKKCGFAIDYNNDKFISCAMNILSNDSIRKLYRRNAVNLAKQFDWDTLFCREFRLIFDQ